MRVTARRWKRIPLHMQLLPSRIPSLPAKLSLPKMSLPIGRRSGQELVGLDIQPGFVAAVKAHVNGGILIERAAALPLPADTVRDGEVLDEGALGEALQELFAHGGLSKRVRIGVANQRTVLRTLELPPVTDPKELAAAVNFQAQEQVPMPLGNAVMDFHALGIVDTPSGPRQRAVLVAAQRDMIERLLASVRRAGLSVEGIDLSAFALIRSLYRADPEQKGRVLYLNVDGLTNLAIAEGTTCRFTRVVGGGLEAMAAELAERRSIALAEARTLIASVDLRTPPSQPSAPPAIEGAPLAGSHDERGPVEQGGATDVEPHGAGAAEELPSPEQAEANERAMSYEELADLESLSPPSQPQSAADAWAVLENGIRDISGEVRNSLDFHRSQEGGGEVTHVVMSGAAEDIPGFVETLQASLGVEVRSGEVGLFTPELAETVSPHRLAVATGLAAIEVPQ
jgi:type IV pilus assembly protein PilM